MTTKLSRGKFENLQKLADDEGTINILGLGEQTKFQAMMKTAEESAGHQFEVDQCIEFKQILSEFLSPNVSGVLLDPTLGTKAMQSRSKDTGLITVYELSDQTPDHFSLNRLVHAKTNGVKVRVPYNPHTDEQTTDQKLALLERVGAEALAADLPLFVEPVVYDDQVSDKSSAEFAKLQPDLVIDTIKELTKERYHIDILQIETPINFAYTEGFAESNATVVYSQREAAKLLKEASDTTTRPFIFQTGDNSVETFQTAVKFAGKAGAKFSGVMTDYSLVQDGITAYATEGEKGLHQWLETTGNKNLTDLNDILENYATPWYDRFGGQKDLELFDNPIKL